MKEIKLLLLGGGMILALLSMGCYTVLMLPGESEDRIVTEEYIIEDEYYEDALKLNEQLQGLLQQRLYSMRYSYGDSHREELAEAVKQHGMILVQLCQQDPAWTYELQNFAVETMQNQDIPRRGKLVGDIELKARKLLGLEKSTGLLEDKKE